ncbi:MAG: monovalent cation/H(+) antiporter subunit G [Aggregatilineales bacterium]
MSLIDLIAVLLIGAGCFFFLAGTLGLLRLPDVFTRAHAITKADNVGLMLIVLAAVLQVESWAARLKLSLIWILILIASATVAHLIGRAALNVGQKPWEEST